MAGVAFDSSGGATMTCSDSQRNTYVSAIIKNDTRHNQAVGLLCRQHQGGSNTVTATFGLNHTYRRLAIHEYSGVAASASLDKTASAAGSSVTVTTPAVTTAVAGELVVAYVMDDGAASSTFTASSGFTLRQSVGATASEDLVQAAAGAISASYRMSVAHDSVVALATFRPGVATDTTPPTIALTAPAPGAVVGGSSVTVSANAADDTAVAGVQFPIDGFALGAEDLVSPYSVTWESTTVTNGVHSLSGVARDAAGNKTTAVAVSVTVNNGAPTGSVTIDNGAAATNSTAAVLTLSASDPAGVTQMRFSNTGSTFSTPEAYATTKAWTLTSGSGTKTVYVQFQNAPGNWSGSFTDTIVLDTTAPTISSVASSSVTSNSARITWTTIEPATSQVEYGTTTTYGTLTPIDNTLVTSHSVTLIGLAASTTYNYRVRSKDAATNEGIGSNATFRTLAGPDTTPPTVSISSPADGATVSGIVNIAATASDNVGVAGVTFELNGVNAIGPEDTTAPYQTTLDTSTLMAGSSYTLTAVARDTSNNLTTSANVTVTIFADTTPPTVPTGLTATAVFASQINLAWTASTDDVGVAGYHVSRDGVVIATATATNYSDTNLTASTSYSYTVQAFDAAGNASAQSSTAQATTPAAPAGVNWPLRISAAGKNLEDQSGIPFLLVADAGWDLLQQLNQADVLTSLDDRKARGFTAIEVMAVSHYMQNNAPNNANNDAPFTNGPSNWSVRNEAYWSNVDFVLSAMKSRSMVAIMFPAYLGYACGAEGWCQQMAPQSTAVMTGYGQWLATRYKSYGNILWMTGGDVNADTAGASAQNAAIVSGIRSVLSDALFSSEPSRGQIGGIDAYVNLVDINSVYAGEPQSMTQTAYGNARPFMLQEGYYENNDGDSLQTVKAETMITYLGGGLVGHVFGTCPMWFLGSTNPVQNNLCNTNAPPFDTWQHNLNSPGSIANAAMGNVMRSRRWWRLVPDYANTVVVSSKSSGINYLATARVDTGETVMVWTPGTSAMTVNMTMISGTQARVWWFDVSTGTSVLVGVYPTTGTKSFTPSGPGKVLVLDDASANLPAPGTTLYSGSW